MNADSSAHPFLAEAWCSAHPLTAHDHAVMTQVRAVAKPNKGRMRGVAARPAFDALIQHTAAPEGVTWRVDRVGHVSGWWCEPAGAPADVAILHLHGGWFNWGSAEAFRHLVGHIARSAGAKAFVPDYRLAPEHPFPAGGEDALACFDGLLELGHRAVAVTGDSAGGNLALEVLATASARIAAQARRLVGAVLLSPVTDLSLSGESWTSRAEADPFFVRDQAEGLVDAYLARHDPEDPLASPLFGALAGLPPIRVHVGDDEVLRDDSLNYVQRAVAAGVDAQVDVWTGMPHGFLGSVGRLEAADAALELLGAFLAQRLSAVRAD
jgi:monoterpene epsilon-lactone hydrolase